MYGVLSVFFILRLKGRSEKGNNLKNLIHWCGWQFAPERYSHIYTLCMASQGMANGHGMPRWTRAMHRLLSNALWHIFNNQEKKMLISFFPPILNRSLAKKKNNDGAVHGIWCTLGSVELKLNLLCSKVMTSSKKDWYCSTRFVIEAIRTYLICYECPFNSLSTKCPIFWVSCSVYSIDQTFFAPYGLTPPRLSDESNTQTVFPRAIESSAKSDSDSVTRKAATVHM